jgi:Flp pilus assembly pilin Flp
MWQWSSTSRAKTTTVCLTLWAYFRDFQGERSGQDLIEYALLAGFVATAVVTMSKEIADSFVLIMSKVNSIMILASAS